ncbi:hypothetical protein CesoFtcFv8_027787 [Champsocephalus esox]|uniref:Uncharacterized protein n=1 Tax=Champsocephalus esox TaxID=159716 RepID=A0AAN8AZ20_9TELE|nr:hypothetical protein CesoFtcFv8_027787 [Champsocephalus esox]
MVVVLMQAGHGGAPRHRDRSALYCKSGRCGCLCASPSSDRTPNSPDITHISPLLRVTVTAAEGGLHAQARALFPDTALRLIR